MAGRHADAEDLAQLAMQSPVSPDVAAHVAECPECTKDLSLLKSLLDAEGPDTGDGGLAATGEADPDVPPTPPAEAMADGNDARAAEPPGASQHEESPAHEVPPADAGRTSGVNATALVVALLIFVGAALLAFFALR